MKCSDIVGMALGKCVGIGVWHTHICARHLLQVLTSMATAALPTLYWQLTSLVKTSPGDRLSGAPVRIERDAGARETCLWSN